MVLIKDQLFLLFMIRVLFWQMIVNIKLGQKKDVFLYSKGRKKDIMISNFILF